MEDKKASGCQGKMSNFLASDPESTWSSSKRLIVYAALSLQSPPSRRCFYLLIYYENGLLNALRTIRRRPFFEKSNDF